MNVTQVLSFGAGAICLGIALTLLLITSLSARYNKPDIVESCLDATVVLLPLALGLFLIAKAVIV